MKNQNLRYTSNWIDFFSLVYVQVNKQCTVDDIPSRRYAYQLVENEPHLDLFNTIQLANVKIM